ncbi:MAG: hypothetical protein AAGA93_26925 [Actinomycetota bacterium]
MAVAIGAGLAYLLVAVLIGVATGVRLGGRDLTVSFALAAAPVALAAANLESGLFEQKFASEIAFQQFKGLERTVDTSTFGVLALLSAPAFLVVDSWEATIGTNIGLVAAVFAYVHRVDARLSLLMLAPAVLNFSIFALRDPLIGACFLGLTLLMSAPALTRRGAAVGLGAALAVTRPESALVVAAVWCGRLVRQQRLIRYRLIAVPFVLAGILAALYLAPRAIGFNRNVFGADLFELLDTFAVRRGQRFDGGDDGGGSNILGGAIVDLPLAIRYPIQLLTVFVLPLPFEIRSLTMALAFVDSIVFITVVARLLRTRHWISISLLGVYVASIAFFAVNYGNLFRLRMPAYFIVLGGLLAVRIWDRSPGRAERRSVADPAAPDGRHDVTGATDATDVTGATDGAVPVGAGRRAR